MADNRKMNGGRLLPKIFRPTQRGLHENLPHLYFSGIREEIFSGKGDHSITSIWNVLDGLRKCVGALTQKCKLLKLERCGDEIVVVGIFEVKRRLKIQPLYFLIKWSI